jgi:hypothetical protein
MNLSTSPSVIKAHDISRFQFRDTPFVKLMNKRIYNVLFIASQYDMFILEDDGRVDEQIFNEYTSLNLRYPPRFTQVSTAGQAMEELRANRYELIICMPNMDNHEIFAQAKVIKHKLYPYCVAYPFFKIGYARARERRCLGNGLCFQLAGKC